MRVPTPLHSTDGINRVDDLFCSVLGDCRVAWVWRSYLHEPRLGVWRKKTSATVLGLQLGLAVVLLIAGAGVGAVLVASANAFLVVKVVGIKQWRASVDSSESAVADATQAVTSGLSKRIPTTRERVLTGMLTNLSNPKGIVFMVAVLPQFIDPSKSLLVQLAILCVIMNTVDTTVMHGYAFLASRLQTLMRSVKAQRNQNRLFGGVLMLIGTSLLLVRRGTT